MNPLFLFNRLHASAFVVALGISSFASTGFAQTPPASPFDAALAKAETCLAAKDFSCADVQLRLANQLLQTPGEHAKVAAVRARLTATQRQSNAAAEALEKGKADAVARNGASDGFDTDDLFPSRAPQTPAPTESQQSNGNWIGQGILEGLGQFQRDSARISSIHNQTVSDIQAEANQRARLEREQAARLRAQESRRRADEARETKAKQAATRAQENRRRADESHEAAEAKARQTATVVAAVPERMGQESAQAQEKMQASPPASPVERSSLHNWTYKFHFTDGGFAQNEQEARRQVSKVRARQQEIFAESAARYTAGSRGYASWREVKVEPVACKSRSNDPSRPKWECSQRIDYAIVSTEPDMGDTIYKKNYSAGMD